MSTELQRLTELLQGMNSAQKQSLLDYAEFLIQKSQQDVSQQEPEKPEQKLQPLLSARPEDENIINAIKRLRASYFMLNTDGLLNETSSLMTQHIVHGRAAVEVIDDLEALFEQHYQNYLQS